MYLQNCATITTINCRKCWITQKKKQTCIHQNSPLLVSPFSLPLASVQFSSVQSLSGVRLFATPWIATHQASLSITNSRSSLKLTFIESVMPSSHLMLWRPLLLLPPIPPSIRVFSNESTLRMRWPKYCWVALNLQYLYWFSVCSINNQERISNLCNCGFFCFFSSTDFCFIYFEALVKCIHVRVNLFCVDSFIIV